MKRVKRRRSNAPLYGLFAMIFLAGTVIGSIVTVKIFKVDTNFNAIPYKDNFYLTASPLTLTVSRYQTTIPAGAIVKEIYETDKYRKFQLEFLYPKSNKGLVKIDTTNLTGSFIYH